MELTKAAQDFFKSETYHDLPSLLNCVNSLLSFNLDEETSLTSDLIDKDFFHEIKEVKSRGVPIFFGRTMKDLKCIVMDSNRVREHEIFIQYKCPKKLAITNLKLPYSTVQDKHYESIEEIILTVKEHVDSLEHYFTELERIDRFCTIMEPVNPTFKEDYRRIMLGSRNLFIISAEGRPLLDIGLPHLHDDWFCASRDLHQFIGPPSGMPSYTFIKQKFNRYHIRNIINGFVNLFSDARIWLHVEVTPDGLATNVHLIGQSEEWQDRLQAGLLKWDHDQDIVENIMTMFDIVDFPVADNRSSLIGMSTENKLQIEVPQCSICLCSELPGVGVPQPLCQNSTCGVFFHRCCLYQWLVACAGGRVPSFGVATGSCPSCFHQIACSEKDY